MKQLIIIIRPNMYFKLKDVLYEEGFASMSAHNVLGRGKQKVSFRAVTGLTGTQEEVYDHPMLAKKMIELVIRDEDCDKVMDIVLKNVKTGNPGDGKIFVIPVENSIRIRTNETGIEAIM